MSLLYNLANKLADKAGPHVDAWARGITDAMPHASVAERSMREDHRRWLQTMQLHRPYWTEDSEYMWVGGEGEPLRLVCMYQYTFVRKDHLGAYTANGVYSWDVYYAAGAKGLITVEPVKPARPKHLSITADLADAAHPERWAFEYVDL